MAADASALEVIANDQAPDLPTPAQEQAASSAWHTVKETVARLSTRIVEEQKSIQVLKALAWAPAIEEQFRASRCKELPRLDPDYWSHVELGFEPAAKEVAFEAIASDIERELGAEHDMGRVMIDTALQYRDVVRMLSARGTPGFYALSRALYGSPKDRLHKGGVTVRELGHVTYEMLTRLSANRLMAPEIRDLDSEQAASELRTRFASFFEGVNVHVLIDDDLLADASAGTDYVKIRKGARFSKHDVDVLEVHEGWVHLATTLNGQAQPVARWLSKAPPRAVATQEGLAALMEIVSGRSHLARARKLNDRILAVDKAEDGASFLDVFEFYRTEGYSEEACFSNSRRVFRGGVLGGGAPFTKDISYGKGLALNFAFLQDAVESGRLDRIALLFVGKISLDDIPMLERRVADGMIRIPTFLPPFVRDLHGLVAMTAFGSLLGNGLLGLRARLGANGGNGASK
jgi:uncharacterized protein (TIGR02421 family)